MHVNFSKGTICKDTQIEKCWGIDQLSTLNLNNREYISTHWALLFFLYMIYIIVQTLKFIMLTVGTGSYCMSMKSCPFLYSDSQFKKGQGFLDIQILRTLFFLIKSLNVYNVINIFFSWISWPRPLFPAGYLVETGTHYTTTSDNIIRTGRKLPVYDFWKINCSTVT